MSTKSNAFPLLQQFVAYVETQFEVSVKIIRTDNGMKFQDHSALQFYAKKGILHQKACVETPQQNGVAERKHKHLLEIARARYKPIFLLNSGGKVFLWLFILSIGFPLLS